MSKEKALLRVCATEQGLGISRSDKETPAMQTFVSPTTSVHKPAGLTHIVATVDLLAFWSPRPFGRGTKRMLIDFTGCKVTVPPRNKWGGTIYIATPHYNLTALTSWAAHRAIRTTEGHVAFDMHFEAPSLKSAAEKHFERHLKVRRGAKGARLLNYDSTGTRYFYDFNAPERQKLKNPRPNRAPYFYSKGDTVLRVELKVHTTAAVRRFFGEEVANASDLDVFFEMDAREIFEHHFVFQHLKPSFVEQQVKLAMARNERARLLGRRPPRYDRYDRSVGARVETILGRLLALDPDGLRHASVMTPASVLDVPITWAT